MSLIALYIHEVIRRLPEKQREDIALELHSTIQDMLPDEYSEEEVKAVLSQLGNPAVLASGYQDRPMYLIGPRYFDIYINLIKMILPIAVAISFISMLADNLISYNAEKGLVNAILLVVLHGIGTIFSTGIQVFFWITVVFAILERTDHAKSEQPLTASFKEWSPDDLKKLSDFPKGKKISKIEVFGGLLWTAIWATVYYNAGNLLGVYEKKSGVLEFVMPVFNLEVLHAYWMIIGMVIVLEIAIAFYKMITGKWTKKLALFHAFYQLISVSIFIMMISNIKLFNPAFITYMDAIFTFHDDWLKLSLAVTGIIVVFIALFDCYQGFRKAKIKYFTK
ncbi:MAG: hypothetical protein ABF649_13070 [Bacillus sp. (in: firmicutes)]